MRNILISFSLEIPIKSTEGDCRPWESKKRKPKYQFGLPVKAKNEEN